MISVVKVKHDEVAAGGAPRLFRSTEPGLADGEQRRDFIWVGDVVDVLLWLLDTPRGQRPVQRRHRPGAELPGPGARGVRRRRRAAQDRVHRHAGGAARPVSVVHRGLDGPAAGGRLPGPVHAARGRRAALCAGLSDAARSATYDPGPAVPAVRSGHRPDRAIRHPLVRAGLYRRAGARVAAAAAPGAAARRRWRRRSRPTIS